MNDETRPPSTGQSTTGQSSTDQRDVLIARIVDGGASADDWRRMRTLAASDQTLWADIADQQELKADLDAIVDAAGDAAERVELPMHQHNSVAPMRRYKTAITAGGWLAAACVLLAWTIGVRPDTALTSTTGPDQTQTGSIGMTPPLTTAADALAKYMELGKQTGEVIGELPTSIVLDRTPNADGGYDVVYLRQIVEKTTVDDVYQTATDDTGRVFMVPKESTAQSAADLPPAL